MAKRRRRSRGRALDGILLLDKPQGMTSNEALQQAKRVYGAAKAGHTGSLDPLATGMLPICFGEATKFSQYMLDADKVYHTTAKLGVRTDTGDAEGEVVNERPVTVGQADVEQALAQFRGDITQVPSMYSAIKVDGQPLYKLAREGKEVERPSRVVSIYQLELLDFRGDEVDLVVHCSKGTYIRTLVEDLGEMLDCGAHVTMLRRLQVGGFAEADMRPLSELSAAAEQHHDWGDRNAVIDPWLLPTSAAVSDLPTVEVTDLMAVYLQQGQPVFVPNVATDGQVLLFNRDADGRFIGIGEVNDDGQIAPRRLLAE